MKTVLKISLVILVLLPLFGLSQNQEQSERTVDSLYREDQLYFGVTYNLISSKPEGLSQTGFSSGFHFGFIRDFPLNTKRNFAIGLGLGFSTNSINQNLQVQEDDAGGYNYELISTDQFTKNKYTLNLIELPLEFRWRSSTYDTYKFWRVYAGFKVGYVIRSVVKYEGDPKDFKLKQIEDFNDFEYGLTLSAGYDKFNVHIYYGLNTVFDGNSSLDGQQIDMSTVKIGLMLYIL
ncbi:MAG: PorT family protein [Bacteroidia bacterium]|nr:PorT family protein [Bacteroidia bacterium]MBT8268216.1 PorT family protein [Bacteroidia bacterium]NNL80116.1 PorT family protein [Flavobacteriaceae bacterium]